MAKFSSSHKQAVSVVNALKNELGSRSIRSDNHHIDALTKAAQFAKENRISLRELSVDQVKEHLAIRGEQVGQNQLDVEARMLSHMLRLTGKLAADAPRLKAESEKQSILSSRAYTRDQVNLVKQHQQPHNRLATEIAYASGLRAHELLTLRRLDERQPDNRPASDGKWRGRDGQKYTVVGKGGLIRIVLIPDHLANELEKRRLEKPTTVRDREIYYKSHYHLGGGNKWSKSFSSASKTALRWSEGAHGLRHSYAQERMKELKDVGLARSERLIIVSQELGHFRPEITEVYLR